MYLVASLLMQRLKYFCLYGLAVVRMNSFQDGLKVWETPKGINIPDKVTFLRPVDGPCCVEDNRASVA